MKKILIGGAGGFIGGHLVKYLRKLWPNSLIRGVDIKPLNQWYQINDHSLTENLVLDLKKLENCYQAVNGFDEVYNLAADMGGMGFIENNKALCMISVLINTHLLIASKDVGVTRYFYSSSACVYNASKQLDVDNPGLKEVDAYPAMPEDGYGWEKLFSERMCKHFREDYGLITRVARFHNVYGSYGTYDGGREKAPAAICRKVISAQIANEKVISVWGDGQQTRSFMYIDDCLEGIDKIMHSNVTEPLNLGSTEMVSINQLIDIIEEIAGIKLVREYDVSAPLGVRGRNSENTLIKSYFDWEPSITLKEGLKETYAWIASMMINSRAKGDNKFNS
jgi:nucleoside-diphosphate-sugar epimerase